MSKGALAAKVLQAPGVGSIARAIPSWSGLLVLAYHRIAGGEVEGPDGGVTGTTQEGFDANLELLVRHADVVSPADLPEVLGARGRHVLVTFDDGYRDNYELAFPVLRRHRVSAAFFPVTGFLDRPRLSWWDQLGWMVAEAGAASLPAGEWLEAPVPLDDLPAAVHALTDTYKRLPAERTETFLSWCGEATGSGRPPPEVAAGLWMTWDMVRELRDGGMAIGGHTDSHPVLARMHREGQEREIGRCAQRLLEELGQEMSLFSYPVGMPDSFGADTREILRERGVEVAFSCYGGYQTRHGHDRYDVRRATVGAATEPSRLNAMIVSPRHFARR